MSKALVEELLSNKCTIVKGTAGVTEASPMGSFPRARRWDSLSPPSDPLGLGVNSSIPEFTRYKEEECRNYLVNSQRTEIFSEERRESQEEDNCRKRKVRKKKVKTRLMNEGEML